MSRTTARFTQADVARAIKGAQACGLLVGSVEITDAGAIKLDFTPKSQEQSPSPYDTWKGRRNAREPDRP